MDNFYCNNNLFWISFITMSLVIEKKKVLFLIIDKNIFKIYVWKR